MIHTVFITQSLIIFDLRDPGIISNEIKNVGWVVSWLESHYLEMIVLEGDEILAMSCLHVSDHAVTLLSECLVHYDIVGVTQDLAHHSASLLRTY